MGLCKETELNDGRTLLIREAGVEDAHALLDHVDRISGESDYLNIGSGEFEIELPEEEEFIRKSAETENQLFLVGLIDGAVVATLTFTAGQRPRVKHSGEFGMAVLKPFRTQSIGEASC